MSKAFLRVVSGPRQGLNVQLKADQPLLIGRSRGDLVLDDPLVSGAHCRIVTRQGRFVLQDLGSTNGSMVNGRRVQDVVLKPGAEIRLGNTRLILFGEDVDSDQGARSGTRSGGAWLITEELLTSEEGNVATLGQGLTLPPSFHAYVEVISGPDLGTKYPFKSGTVAIGRRQGEVPLTDPEVSRRHAFIEVFGRGMVFLRDVASTNGTYHNGNKVESARLLDGDTVGCGKSVLKYKVG